MDFIGSQGKFGMRWNNGGLEVTSNGGSTWGSAGAGGFGSDTLVQLPNSVATLVTALEVITTLPTNTAGAEVSQWDVKLLNGGAQGTAATFKPAAFLVPTGASANPGLSFISFPTAGLVPGVGIGTLGAINVVANATPILQVDYQFGLMTIGSGYFYYLGTDHLRGMGYAAADASAGAMNLCLFSNKDVQIGQDNALNTTATFGFLDMPACAGAPTGVPDSVRTGKIAFVVDSTNFKLYGRFGASWKSVTLA
jgi:hypothetical protein